MDVKFYLDNENLLTGRQGSDKYKWRERWIWKNKRINSVFPVRINDLDDSYYSSKLFINTWNIVANIVNEVTKGR